LSTRRRLAIKGFEKLSGFGDFAGFDTAGTNLLSLCATLWQLHANGLQVWIESPRRSIVCVGNIVPELGAFAADFATFCHDVLTASEFNYCCAAHRLSKTRFSKRNL
jgi:hypothetical protein